MTARRGLRIAAAAAGGLTLAASLGLWLIEPFGQWRLARAQAELTAILGPMEFSAHAPPPVPDSLNAVILLTAAAEAISTADADRSLAGGLARLPAAEWSARDLALARHSLEINRRALALLTEARELQQFSFGLDYERGLSQEFPDLLAYLRVAKLLAIEARTGVLDGDFDRALAASRSQRQLAVALRNESPLLFQMIATACDRLFLQGAWELVTSHQTPERIILALTELLEQPADAGNHRHLLAGEIAGLTSFGAGDLERMELPDGFLARRFEPLIIAQALTAFQQLATCLEFPYREAAPCVGEIQPRGMGGMIAQMLIPNLVDANLKQQFVAAGFHLARTATRLRLEAMSRGSYSAADQEHPQLRHRVQLTDELVVLTALDGGSVELALPTAEALWKEITGAPMAQPPPFSYRLPAL